MAPSIHPMMCRLVSIGGIFLPLAMSPPFTIGFYHGCGKPELQEFFEPFINELITLKKSMDTCIKVDLRCIIGDAPMRGWMKCKYNINSLLFKKNSFYIYNIWQQVYDSIYIIVHINVYFEMTFSIQYNLI